MIDEIDREITGVKRQQQGFIDTIAEVKSSIHELNQSMKMSSNLSANLIESMIMNSSFNKEK
jgi:archaellum component FlaC